jgi:hypothetical protein
VRGLCGICGLGLLSDLDKERKICISCWKKGFHVPMLNKKVFVIPELREGVIRAIDTDNRNALVEFSRRREKMLSLKLEKMEPFWERRDWVGLNDLRLWTKKRAKSCKLDADLWRKESMP